MHKLAERVRGVLLQPRQSLPLTLAESGAPEAVFRSHVALLAAVGPVILFFSDGVIGAWHAPVEIFNTTIPGGWVRAPLPALLEMLLSYGLSVGAWVLLASVMALLAPWFGGLRDRAGALKAAAYTLTPVWISAGALLFGSVPYLTWMAGLVLVAGVAWAAFVAVVALPLHLGTPDARAPGHSLAALGITALATCGIYFLISSLVYAIWSSRA